MDGKTTGMSFLNERWAFDWEQPIAGQRAALYGLANIRQAGVVLAYGDGVQG